MRRALQFAVVGSMLLAAGCGSDDADAPGAGDATVPAAVSTTPASTTPTDTAVEGTQPPQAPTSEAGGDADCLQGSWRADAAELQRRIDTLAAPITFTVGSDSYSSLVIDGETYTTESSTTITGVVTGAGVELTASGTSAAQGTIVVEGSTIRGEVTSSSNDVTDWSATINGMEVPMPAGGFGDPPDLNPSFAGSTFACDDTTLSFTVPGAPIGSITYTRQG
jgi:hypothetical protein